MCSYAGTLRRQAVSNDPFLARQLRLRLRDEAGSCHPHPHCSPLTHPGGYRRGLKQIPANEVSGTAATVQCVSRLWAANQHTATANGGISIRRLFHQAGVRSELWPAFSNRWIYWRDAQHHIKPERRNVFAGWCRRIPWAGRHRTLNNQIKSPTDQE